MIDYIQLACMLRTYRICNSTVGFSKYEFNNKLLHGITLLRVTTLVCKYIWSLFLENKDDHKFIYEQISAIYSMLIK